MRVPGAVIGGVAASLLGRPRMTQDVDILVSLEEKKWPSFVDAGARFGIEPRIANAIEFAGRSRVLLARHIPSGIHLDVVFAALLFEEDLIAKARWANVDRVRIPLPAVEYLIVMKAVAHRPRDIADIESLIEANPRMDFAAVRRWVREFSQASGDPEILDVLKRTLATRRIRAGGKVRGRPGKRTAGRRRTKAKPNRDH